MKKNHHLHRHIPPLPHHFTASVLQFKPGICRSKGKSEKYQD